MFQVPEKDVLFFSSTQCFMQLISALWGSDEELALWQTGLSRIWGICVCVCVPQWWDIRGTTRSAC